MNWAQTRAMELLALDCPLELGEFLAEMEVEFALPPFAIDCEDSNEWGLVVRDGIEFNVSRPYERESLAEWNPSIPAGSNFSIILQVSEDCPPEWDRIWSAAVLAVLVGQRIADRLDCRVSHYRSSYPADNPVSRKIWFLPMAE